VRKALVDLLGRGQGFVVTHHALAGWPAWEGWAEALGGRFHYAPGRLRGRDWPSSGTRLASYTARVVAPDHPVCAGVADFPISDELYCCPVFEDEIVPLLRADAPMDGELFTSTYEHVLDGEAAAPDCRDHPRASDAIAWATTAGRSPLVYVQPGDSAATFGLSAYRALIANALAWVASPDAHRWAADHPNHRVSS
jgi:type 1 glutamine amidotransferase